MADSLAAGTPARARWGRGVQIVSMTPRFANVDEWSILNSEDSKNPGCSG
jgi:hypothetical protein